LSLPPDTAPVVSPADPDEPSRDAGFAPEEDELSSDLGFSFEHEPVAATTLVTITIDTNTLSNRCIEKVSARCRSVVNQRAS